jgi:hypothetical protein
MPAARSFLNLLGSQNEQKGRPPEGESIATRTSVMTAVAAIDADMRRMRSGLAVGEPRAARAGNAQLTVPRQTDLVARDGPVSGEPCPGREVAFLFARGPALRSQDFRGAPRAQRPAPPRTQGGLAPRCEGEEARRSNDDAVRLSRLVSLFYWRQFRRRGHHSPRTSGTRPAGSRQAHAARPRRERKPPTLESSAGPLDMDAAAATSAKGCSR